ncbi:arginine--tRNA ligase [Patescibacteria group bacterium]|nr:arginine--tRNA ligase [Patescibacteria group bacterium]MBU3923096.1 arginine--tRNA ligase [Patescibacteria group bacterium]
MVIRRQIKEIINKAIKSKIDFVVEAPQEKSFGDYATNVAMLLAKKKSPIEVAGEIKLKIKTDLFEKIEIVKPGFINFFLKDSFLQNQVKEIIKGSKINIGKGKKIQVEFISANPTGPLTIANARGGPMGDVLANVLNKAGFKVEKEYYVNDSGNQILSLGNSVLGNKEGEYKGEYINKLNIKEKDPFKAGQKAAKLITEKLIKKTIDKLGVKYDKWFFESSLDIKKTIDILKRKKLTYEKEGALWFKSSKFGDNRDRVLIKKDGLYTYLADDIAYHLDKFKIRKFDKVINILGADHHGDVPSLMAGVDAIGFKGKLEIILHQFVTIIKNGKQIRMSKRKGNFETLDDLLKEVGSDSVRFFFLMHSANRHMEFDLDLAKEKSQKNPVFYIQYAYARINSILKKAKPKNPNLKLLNHPSELDLIKQLIKLPEIIEDTVKDYQVQRLPHYAMEVASAFHRFYTDCKVLGDYKEMENARLSLVLATKTVLEEILDLMGISKPKKM